jgi:hypothetical protein
MSQEFNEEYAQSEFTEEYQSEYQSEHESENIMITPGTCLYYNSFSFLRPIFITIVNIIASELFSTLKKEIDELKRQNEILKNRQTSVNHQSVVSKKEIFENLLYYCYIK